MAKKYNIETPSVNLLAKGTRIEGKLYTEGDIRIDGKIIGSLHVGGKLILGKDGSIEGDVVCTNAEILGTFKANVKVIELLSLKASSKVFGEVVTKRLSVEPGAIFECNCKMGQNDSKIKTLPKIDGKGIREKEKNAI